MTSIGGFQRVIDYISDREVLNDNLEDELVVLGKRYSIDVDIHSTDEETEIEQEQPHVNDQESALVSSSTDIPTETPSDHLQLDTETKNAASNQTAFDKKINEIKNYFHNTQLFSGNNKANKHISWPKDFIDDVYTRIWLTYRTGFPMIERVQDGPTPLSFGALIRGNIDLNNKGFTSDAGWGCMIRTSQSLLANALLNLHVGRDWRYIDDTTEKGNNHKETQELDCQNDENNRPYSELLSKHIDIISWFIDIPPAPFSIHQFVDVGMACSGKKPGEWFGPSAASKGIETLCGKYPKANLKVYLATTNGEVYKDELLNMAHSEGEEFSPVLVLAGLRLGIQSINSLYWDSIKHNLEIPQAVGIAGGRPSSSHYFYGYQGDYLFYLDPHIPQKALLSTSSQEVEDMNKSNYVEISSHIDVNSVHSKKVRKIHLKEMDPSVLVGIMLKSEEDFLDWEKSLKQFKSTYKIIDLFETKAAVIPVNYDSFTKLGDECCVDNLCDNLTLDDTEDEDFVDLGVGPVGNTSPKKEQTGIETENVDTNENKSKLDASMISTTENAIEGYPLDPATGGRRYSAPVMVSAAECLPNGEGDSLESSISGKNPSDSILDGSMNETFEKIEKPEVEVGDSGLESDVTENDQSLDM